MLPKKRGVFVEAQTRIGHFPIMMFAIVMGMGGLSLMYQKAGEILGFPAFLGQGLLVVSTAIFLFIGALYSLKALRYFDAVRHEFAHPVRINFFSAISISMLMLAIGYKELFPSISALFWYSGTLLHLFLTLHTIAFWINHNQQLDHSSPAWFIPIVGNVLVPLGGIGFVPTGALFYFLSIGLFFWVVLFSIVLNRIIFHNQLATKFMPTLFILIAPPAVGFLSYLKLTHTLDTFALMLYNLGLFFTLLIAFMYKNFVKIKFFISWWAFIFPLAAMAISTMVLYGLTKEQGVLYLAYILIATTTIIVGIVIYQTLLHVKRGEICVQE